MGHNEIGFFHGNLAYHSLQQVAWSPFGMREPLSDTPCTRPFRRDSPLLICCLWIGGIAPNAGRSLVAGKIGTGTFCRAIFRIHSIVLTRRVPGGETERTSSDSIGIHTRAVQYPSGRSTRYTPRR